MLDKAQLKIIDVEFNNVNGGSFSITAAKKQASYPEATDLISNILQDEVKRGLSVLTPYLEFADLVKTHRNALISLLGQLKSEGKKVLGYGASTKGNVLLQYCGLTRDDLSFVAEVNEDKFGSFTPGTRIPIISEKQAHALNPDYFLVLPWHFSKGILEKEKGFLDAGGQFIFPLPKIQIVSNKGSYFPEYDKAGIQGPNLNQNPSWILR
jgi:hypothetical protein